MKKSFVIILLLSALVFTSNAQDKVMTPELLWKLGRVSPVGLTKDGNSLIFAVTHYDVMMDSKSKKYYSVPVKGGDKKELDSIEGLVNDAFNSPNGEYAFSLKSVKLEKISGKDYYPEMDKSDVKIYNSLHYRHWDTWRDGSYNHVFLHKVIDGKKDDGVDIMKDELFDTPTVPFGGAEDVTWSADSNTLVYVSKKLKGTEYVESTNTDLYSYDVESGETTNLTKDNPGYDTHPSFSSKNQLAWLRMARDGYEADKNDLIVRTKDGDVNLTKDWDNTVNGFMWSNDGKSIFFTAPTKGTIQIYQVGIPKKGKKAKISQLTDGDFDANGIIAQVGKNELIITRNDMNHARELFHYHLKKKKFTALSKENDEIYDSIGLSKIERRWFTATDGEKLMSWVIYPPNFDPNKKYPTLLYCQGGPQGALSQFYSFRWNFQVMAAQGYIVVAPNRRGMPGHGVKWNEDISKEWGGQAIDDYLTSIDEMAKEPFVDNERLGAIGASYGGYSVFYLAGKHEGRFKSFIAHAGVFNLKSMYGSTEELFFVNWDLNGPYWNKNEVTEKVYSQYDPSNYIQNWDTPMLVIHGGKDFRVPYTQGLEAFTALQVKDIKSRLVFFPEENHWILTGQNALIWHSEFFKWLKETL